jgi:uncharacterized protein YqhQ
MEGVLMRGKDHIGVAVRGPDGQIFAGQEALNSVLHRNRFARAPFFRGVVVLYETLVIGTKWLMRSGSLAAAGEGVAFGGKALALTMLFTVALAVGLFVLLPLVVATGTTSFVLGGAEVGTGLQAFVVHLLEGLIRVVIFVGYLLVVSRSAEIGRVFRYHGAEHMTIHTLESNLPLTVENVRRYPTAHPRCGTEFLVVFIIVSIILFSFLAGQALWIAILGRILLIPVIAAVAYEILKWGARHRHNRLARWLFLPGIWLQSITTKQPDDSMIEIAICSMQEALKANGDTAPAGSWNPEREPIPDAGVLAKDMEARIDAEEAAEAASDTTDGAEGDAEAVAASSDDASSTTPAGGADAGVEMPVARTGGAPAEGA